MATGDESPSITRHSTEPHDATERRRTEEALRNAHNELEMRVQERTAELTSANEQLQREISERKRAEEALRLQSEMMKNMAEAVYLVRASDGVIVYTNPAFEKLFGYDPGEMDGKHVSTVNAPTDKSPEETAKEIIATLDSTGVWSGEVHNIKKDGTPFWCYANVSTFDHAHHGQVWVTYHTDITERKRTEEALRESEERFRSVFELAPVAMAIGDAEGRPVQINGALREMLGFTEREIKSMVYTDFTHPDDVEESVRLTRELLAGKRDYFRMEKRYYRKDGRLVWASVVASEFRHTEGKRRYVAMIEDITDRKRAEEALQVAREELEGKVEHQILRRNPYRLTFRELTVLHLVGAGRSDKQIGLELGISPLTASKHLSNILAKMSVASRTEASVRAVKEGLLD